MYQTCPALLTLDIVGYHRFHAPCCVSRAELWRGSVTKLWAKLQIPKPAKPRDRDRRHARAATAQISDAQQRSTAAARQTCPGQPVAGPSRSVHPWVCKVRTRASAHSPHCCLAPNAAFPRTPLYSSCLKFCCQAGVLHSDCKQKKSVARDHPAKGGRPGSHTGTCDIGLAICVLHVESTASGLSQQPICPKASTYCPLPTLPQRTMHCLSFPQLA